MKKDLILNTYYGNIRPLTEKDIEMIKDENNWFYESLIFFNIDEKDVKTIACSLINYTKHLSIMYKYNYNKMMYGDK